MYYKDNIFSKYLNKNPFAAHIFNIHNFPASIAEYGEARHSIESAPAECPES